MKKWNWTLGQNEPKQTQFKANLNPKQSQNKPKQSQPVVSLPALSEAEGSNLFYLLRTGG
jgi:hypothetical protein